MRRSDRLLSRSDDRGVAARPSRRRHRRHRLFQCGILRAVEAGLAMARRRRQGQADGRTERRAVQTNSPAWISISRRISRTMSRRPPQASKARIPSSCSAMTCRPAEDTADEDQGGDGQGARHRRSGGVQFAWPADGARFDIDRARAARYGLATGDINTVIQAAIGGQAAGNLYETGSDRNYPIMVRLAPQYRGSLDAIHAYPGRRGQPVGRCADADSAVGHRRRQAGFGRVLHLPRESGTLYPHQVQRARPRSGRRGPGRAKPHRRRSSHAPGLSPGMGGRVRRIAGSDGAAGHCRPASAWC